MFEIKFEISFWLVCFTTRQGFLNKMLKLCLQEIIAKYGQKVENHELRLWLIS
jgi:hypothetical protein